MTSGCFRPTNVATLANGEVHAWYVSIDALDGDKVERCEVVLSADERARRDRFVFGKDRDLYQVAHALVRTTLSRYADVDPTLWRFATNRYGRPDIILPDATPSLRFNLSHTPGMAICAVALDREVGVDVEDLQRRKVNLSIAHHYFSSREVADLMSLPEHRQQDAFFDYWTLKESYIKARGMGLSIPLDQFSFHLATDRPIEISFAPPLNDDPSSWQFAQCHHGNRHKMALAIRRRGEDLRVRWLETAVEL